MRLFIYSIGSLGLNLLQFIFISHFLFYYDSKEGEAVVPLIWITIILSLGRVLDAFTDPLIGQLSDRYSGRWGRRRVFLMFFLPCLLLSFYGIWQADFEQDWMNILFLFIVVNLFFISFTGYGIPYDAHLPEIAKTQKKSVLASGLKSFFGLLGTAVAVLLLGIGDFNQTLLLTLILAMLVLGIVIPSLNEESSNKSFSFSLTDLKLKKYHPSFISFLFFVLFMDAGMGIFIKNLDYFVKHVLMLRIEADQDWIRSQLLYSFLGGVLIGLPLWGFAKKLTSTSHLLRLSCYGLILSGFFYAVVGFFTEGMLWCQIIFAFGGLSFGGYTLLVIVAVVEFSRRQSQAEKEHREGSYFGLFNFVKKTGIVIGLIVFTSVVELGEFVHLSHEQYILMGPSMSLLMLPGIYFLKKTYG